MYYTHSTLLSTYPLLLPTLGNYISSYFDSSVIQNELLDLINLLLV